MKKLFILFLTAVVILSMLTGCRRQPDGNPGDPTVNNSTDASTIPSTSTQATRPSTEPTMHTTVPDSTLSTSDDYTNGSDSSEEGTLNSEARNRDRMITRR